MSVTVISARIIHAGIKVFPLQNASLEIVKLSGASIGNNDTGTYTPATDPVLDAGGLPVVIGLPHGIQPSIASGVITWTVSASATFTALNVYVAIVLKKRG